MFERLSGALAERDFLARFERLVPLISSIDQLNLTGAVDAYDESLKSISDAELKLLMHAWARIDALDALEHVQSWPRKSHAVASSAIMINWARRDPRAAASEAHRRGDAFRTMVASAIVQGWATSGEPGVEDWIATQPAGPERTRMVSVVIAERLLEGRPEDVRAWAEAIPAKSAFGLKRVVFRRATNQLGQVHPEETAAWLEPHLGQIYTVGTERELMMKWLQSDPDAAWEWVGRQPEDDERGSAIEEGTATWLRQDRAAALGWFDSASLESLHDPGLVALADALSPEPETALSWVLRIHDPILREKTLSKTLAQWARREGEAARTWLRTAPLTLETRQALLPVIVQHARGGNPQRGVRVEVR